MVKLHCSRGAGGLLGRIWIGSERTDGGSCSLGCQSGCAIRISNFYYITAHVQLKLSRIANDVQERRNEARSLEIYS